MLRQSFAVIVLALLLGQQAPATLSLSKSNKFDLNWYFHNTSTTYTEMASVVGYYRDYDEDGLPDYFIVLEDPTLGDWRLIALNTLPTHGRKTDPANVTASRNIPAQAGVFIPDRLFTPLAPSMDSPDLVVVGTNATTVSGTYTRFTFRRLNKYSRTLPTSGTWFIDVASTFTPVILWPDVSFNGDDYPDFLIYHARAPSLGVIPPQFGVACYDGRNGARLWARAIGLDPQDPETGLPGFGYCPPTLTVNILPHNPEMGIWGDFDGNGKPEILLFYTFAFGDFYSTFTVAADITMLNSSGNFLSPYSATWTRAANNQQMLVPPVEIVISDYNRDSFVDMLLLSINSPPAVPLFRGYNLGNRQLLFQSRGSDFSNDTANYLALDHLSYGSSRRADVTGDGWNDLDVFRPFGVPNSPLRVGLFNAWAGGGVLRGRLAWLVQHNSYNHAISNANDFNGDDILDYVLVKTPDAPNSPTLGRITFNIANTTVSPLGMTFRQRFTYAPLTPPPPLGNRFISNALYFGRAGDLDGDGMRDTVGSLISTFFDSAASTYFHTYGYLFIYDNTPGLAAPPLTAELEFHVDNEDWIPTPVFMPAVARGSALVDNNRDGFWNDVIVLTGNRAVWAFSYQYQVIGGPPQIESATFSDLDGNGVDAGDLLLLTLNRSVEVNTSVLKPSHFFLPVQGDRLGGNGFSVSTSARNSQILAITLGAAPRMTFSGLFSMAKRTPGSPSGIDFATSLPVGAIRSVEGISAINGGAPNANDSGIDIRFNVIGRTKNLGGLGGTVAPANLADAKYRYHKLTVPFGALASTDVLTVKGPVRNLGVPGVFQIIQASMDGFLTPATITAEFHLNDVDRELGNLLSEVRVHQLVERLGQFSFVPVHGTHHLGNAMVSGGSGGFEKLNGNTKTVSVEASNLNPEGSSGTPGLFAGLPIETVDEHAIDMKAGSGVVGPASVCLLIPGGAGAYTGHKLEFPGYETALPTDPNRLVVKIRTATLAERISLTGGQSFPMQSGAVFVVTVTDALSLPVQFTDPVNITVQFKDRPDPVMTDVVRFDGSLAIPQNMRLVRDYSVDGVHFAFVTGITQTASIGQGTLTAQGVTTLTDATGMGTYGVVSPQGAAPVAHWELYP